jgi:cytidine deaminase
MRKVERSIAYTEYDSPKELSQEEQQLLQEAKRATEGSYSPYSHFAVGAAVLLENGEIITGSNQENAAYPVGLCAERVALFYASHKYPDIAVKAIAITAKSEIHSIQEPVKPCGSCRQVMAETEYRSKQKMKILLQGNTDKIIMLNGTDNLLPFSFNGDDL